MIINAEGIVLRQRKIANNRRMIEIFTKQYGKISAGTSINERSRNKSALALRPFTYAEYDIFKGRESYSINSASVLHSYYAIGEDIKKYMTAASFIEYLEKVLEEGESMPKLFELSLQFMESVSRTESNPETLLYAFTVKSLKMFGVMPELNCCVGCGKEASQFADPKIFSVSSGGIICEDCANEEKTESTSLLYKPSFDIIGVFRYFDLKPLKTFEKVSLKENVNREVKEILGRYTERYLSVNVLDHSRESEV